MRAYIILLSLLWYTIIPLHGMAQKAIPVSHDNIIDFGDSHGRTLDLNAQEVLAQETFLTLAADYEQLNVPLVIVRVNKGPYEQYYDWYSYKGLQFHLGKKDPLTKIRIVSEDFYILKKDDDNRILCHLGHYSKSNRSSHQLVINHVCHLYDIFAQHNRLKGPLLYHATPRQRCMHLAKASGYAALSCAVMGAATTAGVCIAPDPYGTYCSTTGRSLTMCRPDDIVLTACKCCVVGTMFSLPLLVQAKKHAELALKKNQ